MVGRPRFPFRVHSCGEWTCWGIAPTPQTLGPPINPGRFTEVSLAPRDQSARTVRSQDAAFHGRGAPYYRARFGAWLVLMTLNHR